MLEIDPGSVQKGAARLRATKQLTSDDFESVASALRTAPRRARKTGLVAARRATHREAVETRWNGKETSDVAEPGDYIVTNMSPSGDVLRDSKGAANTYVVRSARFASLYERTTGDIDLGEIYRPLGIVDAIALPGGFDIVAPWGERQLADAGYLIRNGEDIYGNNKETFEATYRIE